MARRIGFLRVALPNIGEFLSELRPELTSSVGRWSEHRVLI
jgi:hypothetical protein